MIERAQLFVSVRAYRRGQFIHSMGCENRETTTRTQQNQQKNVNNKSNEQQTKEDKQTYNATNKRKVQCQSYRHVRDNRNKDTRHAASPDS